MKMLLVEDAELNTILGALRYYQNSGLADDPEKRPGWLQDVVCPGADETSLGSEAVDNLCERINVDNRPAIFLQGNLSEGFKACGPYPDLGTAADEHDGEEGWLMSLELRADASFNEYALNVAGEMQLKRTLDDDETAAHVAMLESMGLQVNSNQTHDNWHGGGTYWQAAIRDGQIVRVYADNAEACPELPCEAAVIFVQTVAATHADTHPFSFVAEADDDWGWERLTRYLWGLGLIPAIDKCPTYPKPGVEIDDEALVNFGLVSAMEEYLGEPADRSAWTAEDRRKVMAWMTAENLLANDNDLPPTPTPRVIAALAEQRQRPLPPRYSRAIEGRPDLTAPSDQPE